VRVYKYTYLDYYISIKVKTPLHTLRKILNENNGIIFTSEITQLQIPRVYLSILEQRGEIERISRGVYKAPSTLEDEMFIFQTKYKASIYSHQTALFIHDLTDRTPLTYSITVPSGYHSPWLSSSQHKLYYVNRKLLKLGVFVTKSPMGSEIRVTNLERTICDILRSRNQMDIQYISMALKRYVSRKDININQLYQYAKSFRIQKFVRQYIEVLL
jgi:predicted transcriptional regulator of viral defense system